MAKPKQSPLKNPSLFTTECFCCGGKVFFSIAKNGDLYGKCVNPECYIRLFNSVGVARYVIRMRHTIEEKEWTIDQITEKIEELYSPRKKEDDSST